MKRKKLIQITIPLIIVLIFLAIAKKDKISEQLNHLTIIFQKETNDETDFEYWKSINDDICALIKIPETNIDYPIVQPKTEPNDYYLKHDIYKEENKYGSIYIEKENNPDFSDQCSIIYGHHMRDGSMFGNLEKYLDEEYLETHKTIQIILPTEQREYEIIRATTYPAVHLLDNPIEDLGPEPMIILSTCSKAGENYRCIVIAKLVNETPIMEE